MYIKPEVLDAVTDHLFGGQDESVKNLFKAIYHFDSSPYVSRFEGKALELVQKTLEQVPGYAKENLPFAYSLASRLQYKLCNLINNLETKEEKNQESPEQAADNAVQETMQDFGLSEDVSGQCQQEGLAAAICDKGDEQLEGELEMLAHGLQAGKMSVGDLSRKVKEISANLSKVQKTLKNVSAVAECIVQGLMKIKSEYSEEGFDYGRDLRHVDKRELVYLADEKHKQLFLLKYAKGELLQETSEDKKALGDMIISVDTSGSTSASSKNGSVLDLELGIALAICKIAVKHKCKAKVLLFEEKQYYETDWLNSNRQLNEIFAKILSGGIIQSGGTSFNSTMNRQCDILEAREYPAKRKPGMILVTDGYDRLKTDRIAALKKRLGVKFYSYFVSNSNPLEYATDVTSVSDSAFWIDTKKDIANQLDAFEQLKY